VLAEPEESEVVCKLRTVIELRTTLAKERMDGLDFSRPNTPDVLISFSRLLQMYLNCSKGQVVHFINLGKTSII
jgi:hypothetical protein